MKRTRSDSTNKLERKTIEKNRRIRMKSLSFKLVSIIPDRHFSQPKVCIYVFTLQTMLNYNVQINFDMFRMQSEKRRS